MASCLDLDISKITAFFISMLCMLVSIGCSSMSYTPSLSLDTSPSTLNLNVKLDKFEDHSPADDHKSRAFGFSATHEKTISGDLATNVTNAILNDFRNNHIFVSIEKQMNNPDVIMSGTIRRFHGTAGMIWATIPIDVLWFVGLPCCNDDGIVDIEVQFHKPNGQHIATYYGSSEFGGIYTIYNERQFALPTRLNEAFNQAVKNIRAKIIENRQVLEGTRNKT